MADGECDSEPNEDASRKCIRKILLDRYLKPKGICTEANVDEAMKKCYQPKGEPITFPHPILR